MTFCQDRGIRDIITCNVRYLDIGIAQEPHARLAAPHLAAARDQAPNEDYARGCRKLHASMSERRPQANRTLAVLSAVWSSAARHRHVDAASNPTKVVEKYRESARERYLTKDELLRLSDALTAAETTGLPYSVDESNPKAKHASKPENRRRKFDRHSVAAIRLLTLTGARLREILDAKWEHVELERGMIFLPDSKTARKPIYLSPAAAAILSALPRIDGNLYVIPGDKTGQPRADLKRPWDAICEVAGLDEVRLS